MRAPQLMALVYIAHGWYLGLTGTPLINEAPEAWEIGPVIPSLYDLLKIYGSNDPIREKISKPEASTSLEPPSESEVTKFLHGVWEAYGTFSDSQLTTLTTKEGTPWFTTWMGEGKNYRVGVDIPERLIQEHYQNLNVKAPPQVPAAVAAGPGG